MTVSLKWLLDGIAAIPDSDAQIVDLAIDSREVRAGYLFFALRGRQSHGLAFAAEAAARAQSVPRKAIAFRRPVTAPSWTSGLYPSAAKIGPSRFTFVWMAGPSSARRGPSDVETGTPVRFLNATGPII